MDKMKAYILKNIEELKVSQIPKIKRPVNIIGKCPSCGKNVVETTKAYSCQGTKDGICNFTLWKDDKFFKTFGKKITETMAKELVSKQKITVKGMKSPKKEGVKFDAIINLLKNEETGYWNFKMDFNNNSKKKSTSNTKVKRKSTIKFK